MSAVRTSVASGLPLPKNESVREYEVAQGRIFWLPPCEELPAKAVRRAHGRGSVDEGIYNHPVVVISHPEEEPDMVHFQVVSATISYWKLLLIVWQITSFQGRRLEEMYGKDNDFHASRRSWYLPVWPAPDHPDANSKKSKKRFPTLKLAGRAQLRWESYINLRHVYKVEWAHLRPYANPDTPEVSYFRLERESTVRMLAKGRVLTNYEPGWQYRYVSSAPSTSETSQEAGFQATEVSSLVNENSNYPDVLNDAEGAMARPPRDPPDPDSLSGKKDLDVRRYLRHFFLH